MTATKRIRNIVISVAAAGATTVALAVTLPASAATLTERGYGQVSVKIVTLARSLGSVPADGNPCQELDWKNIENLDYFGLPGNDGKTLRAIKGAQLTFRGYSSTDCSGQPASIIIRTFGDPDLTWATGSLYYMPWESN